MKIHITSQQQRHFSENGALLLEAFLPIDQCSTLFHLGSGLDREFDLWRQLPHFKKLVCSRRLTGLIAELVGEKVLRLAGDWIWQAGHGSHKKEYPLKNLLSVQGIQAAVVFCVDGPDGEEDAEDPFPKKVGDISLVSPEQIINLPALNENPRSFYCVAYALPAAVYTPVDGDPNKHHLKTMGYAIHDALRDSTHPLFVMH